MFYDNDLDDYFTDFGVSASFSHAGGAPSTVTVIFDNAFQFLEGVQSTSPTVTCKTTDVATAIQGDTLTIGGTVFNIIEVQPDGTGITTLLLSRD